MMFVRSSNDFFATSNKIQVDINAYHRETIKLNKIFVRMCKSDQSSWLLFIICWQVSFRLEHVCNPFATDSWKNLWSLFMQLKVYAFLLTFFSLLSGRSVLKGRLALSNTCHAFTSRTHNSKIYSSFTEKKNLSNILLTWNVIILGNLLIWWLWSCYLHGFFARKSVFLFLKIKK